MKTEYYTMPTSKKEYDKIPWPIEPLVISHLMRVSIKTISGMGWTIFRGKLKKLVIDFHPEAL